MADEDYVLLGEDAILELLGEEHAVLRREIEAKISDRVWRGMPNPIYPHNLTVALRRLQGREPGHDQRIEFTKEETRGGSRVGCYHLANPRARRILTKVDRASARKRLLYARYRGWGKAQDQYPSGLIGPAGERVVRSTFRAVADQGFTRTGRDSIEVPDLLGVDLRSLGTLDDARHLVVEDERGRPLPITVPVEVKNRRAWIYPRFDGLFQLLHKAAIVQRENPDALICPVLISRRRSYKALAMGIDLGFYAIQARRQYLLPLARIEVAQLEEVRRELEFSDLRKKDDADDRLGGIFVSSLKRDALLTAQRWQQVAPVLVDEFEHLRDSSVSGQERDRAMEDLRAKVARMEPRADHDSIHRKYRGVW